MSFWSRVSAWFGRAKSTSTSLPAELSSLARGFVLGRRDQAAMLRAFSDYPHLHTVVRGRAEAASAVEWQVYTATKGARAADLRATRLRGGEHIRAVADLVLSGYLTPAPDSPLLRMLRRPSLTMSGPDFWELASMHEDLVGEFLWLKARDTAGRLAGLLPLVPTWLQRMPTYEEPTFTVQAPGRAIHGPAADLVWRRRLDPVDPYNCRGVGTAMVLRDELQTDELMARMARGRFANRGLPDLLLGLLGFSAGPGPKPGQTEVDRLSMQLEQKHKGEDKVGQAHIIAGDFKAQPLGQSLIDNQYMEGRRFNRDTVMQTFRRPPELAGVLDNANRSTIDVAEDLEARANTMPKLDRFRAAIQDDVAPEYGDDLVVSFASPVPADREYQAAFLKSLPASFLLDEIRARAGHGPLPNGEGNVLYKAPGAVPVAGSPSTPHPEKP